MLRAGTKTSSREMVGIDGKGASAESIILPSQAFVLLVFLFFLLPLSFF